MMLNFRNNSSPRLQSLGKLKMVIGCGVASSDEELLLKEFLVYKIYNLLEEKVFVYGYSKSIIPTREIK